MGNTAAVDRSRTWLITGCSTGFGRVLAEEVIARGEQVVATARRPEAIADLAAKAPGRVLASRLDVTDPATVASTVQAAFEKFGRIDVLVNNAGYVVVGGAEEVAEEELRPLFDTNFFGVVTVTKAVLPIMRKQRRGRIINISSMGGISGGVGMAYYGATKFAMSGWSESLREEAGPLGIYTTVIEPGGFRTAAIAQAQYSSVEIEDYRETVGRHRGLMRAHAGSEPNDARDAALAMIKVADAQDPPMHLPLGADALARLDQKIDRLISDRESWRETILLNGLREEATAK